MLEIKNLCFSANDGAERIDILKNIDLTIEDGTFLVLTGPNGGGKTTLAKAISGIVQPTGGNIIWNGLDITNMSITERAHNGISYGFQQPPRFTGMTVKALLQIAYADGNCPGSGRIAGAGIPNGKQDHQKASEKRRRSINPPEWAVFVRWKIKNGV